VTDLPTSRAGGRASTGAPGGGGEVRTVRPRGEGGLGERTAGLGGLKGSGASGVGPGGPNRRATPA
jgi:hypothetical protein